MYINTSSTTSLAERAMMSAQETVDGHSDSTASLIVSMYLKFLIPKLLVDAFSDCMPVLGSSSNKIDASHDYVKSLKMLIG